MHRLARMAIQLNPAKAEARLLSTASVSATDSGIIIDRPNAKLNNYTLVLNRPKALNSLNISMIEAMTPFYNELVSAKKPSVVLVKGSGGKAFCAGGDVRYLYDLKKAGASIDEITYFFRIEYELDHLMGRLPDYIHNVSILNGITMGGGVGISVHGRYRIATDNTLFAMPETAIGFYTDVGGAHFLPRMVPNGIGTYLALTGHRLKGADCLHAGIATHFVPKDKLESLEAELIGLESAESVEFVLSRYAVHPSLLKGFSLNSDLESIQKHFSLGSVEEIVASLEKDDSDFAQNSLRTMNHVSPTALKVVFAALQRGKHLSLKQVLEMELKVVSECMRQHDAFEGIRAVLVDKDKFPQWKPQCLKSVKDADIEKYFV